MNQIRDGDLFKAITLFGKTFEIRYGYYEEYERQHGIPVPLYPDFKASPVYTKEGHPFVTQMQELCAHGESPFSDGCCVDCKHYRHGDDLLGICVCKQNARPQT